MNPDYLPVLILVAFVIYPFAVIGVTAFIVSRSRRERFPIPAAKLFAFGACIVVAWFMFTYGLGKLPPVTLIASAVFVLGVAATGGLLGAIAELFVPTRTNAGETRVTEPTDDGIDDGNPYTSPKSHDIGAVNSRESRCAD
jgi:hypothetical protein